MRVFLVYVALIVGSFTQVAFAQVSGSSPTCGPISGQTRQDLQNVRTFCERGIPEKGLAVGAYGMESLLWVKVGREIANQMLTDRLTTEQLVKTWMKLWKALSGSQVVTVKVEWEDVEIAEGDTTIFSGDKVTIRGR